MKRIFITKLALASIALLSLNSCLNRRNKTSFTECDELFDYVEYRSYNSLKYDWGDGEIGKVWDASGGTKLKMKVSVRWDNVTLNGKPIEMIFKNDFYDVADATTPNPNKALVVECNDGGRVLAYYNDY